MPTLAELPLIYRGYPHPHAEPGRPPLNRSSSLRQYANEKETSEKPTVGSESDELDDDEDEQDGDAEDAFMANQKGKRKGKAG